MVPLPAPAAELPGPYDMVEALADDSMRGRGVGSPELAAAAVLVQGWFEDAGLAPGMDGAWTQPVAGPEGESLVNVVGKVAGTGEEWIVVGAHYDGLGVGAPGTDFAGEILNGGDDNASGVAALVEVAHRVAEAGELERSVVFVAFTGEEIGRLGSEAFVAAPPLPLEKCAAMLNLDTVGRLRDDRLIVFGTGTAEEFPGILQGVNYAFGFDLAFNSEGAGASDHASFFAKGIPVLHFFSGTHPDYHRPGDDVAQVNVDGVAKIAEFVAETAVYLAAEAEPLTFHPPGVERVAEAPAGTQRRRVSFGSIPDFSRESGGILLTGVMPESPAEEAGLRAGDILLEMDGVTLDTIQDFQGVLSEHEPGDVVAVRYQRGDEVRDVTVTLKERRG